MRDNPMRQVSKAGKTMKFNNLDCNILYVIIDDGHPPGSKQCHLKQIYEEFSDIPKNDINQAIKVLRRDGRIAFNPGTKTLTATRSGVKAINSSAGCPFG
jgi:hypothetical protein